MLRSMKEILLSRLRSLLVHNRSSRDGQSLVEAMVAIAISALVVTALVGLATGAVRSANAAKNRALAVSYAQEGIEAIRSIRDRSFSELPPAGGPYQLVWNGSEWNWSPGEQSLGTIFKRSFTVVQESVGKLVVTLTVSWTDSVGAHSVILTSYITDWR